MLLSLALVVAETLLAPLPRLGVVAGTRRRVFRSAAQYPEAAPVPGVAALRVDAPLIYLNAPAVLAALRAHLYAADGTRAVVLDLSNVPYFDSAFTTGFGELLTEFAATDGHVIIALANPNSAVLHKLALTPLLAALNAQGGGGGGGGGEWVFLSVTDAVDAVLKFEPPLQPRKLPAPEDEDEAAEP